MPSFKRSIEREIRRVELEHRVAILEDPSAAVVTRGTDSITSPVPYVRLDRGLDQYEGRRRRVLIESDAGKFTLLVRRRTPPVLEGKRSNWIIYATDDRGREIPVTVADPATHALHVLVDLETAEVIEGDRDRAAAAVVAELVAGPLERFLKKDEAPSIGSRVPHRLRALLQRQGKYSTRMLERELAFMRRLRARSGISRPMVDRRLALLDAAVEGKAARSVDLAACEHEAERLGQLVESRACASLKVDEDRVRGMLNPRRLDASWGIRGFNFSLWPAPELRRPELALWRIGERQPPAPRICLGRETIRVLTSLEESLDVFGLVDTVLNFVETNQYGRVRSDGENLPDALDPFGFDF